MYDKRIKLLREAVDGLPAASPLRTGLQSELTMIEEERDILAKQDDKEGPPSGWQEGQRASREG